MESKGWIVALVLVLVLVGATLLYGELGSGENTAPIGGSGSNYGNNNDEHTDNTTPTRPADAELATDFTVYDANGRAVRLSDFRGKPVVLNIWASWCPPCRNEMPYFQAKYQELGDDVCFLMVNCTEQDSIEDADQYIAQNGYTFPIYYDTNGAMATAYGITGVPRTYFIDAEGYILSQARGGINMTMLENGLDLIR